MRVSHGKRQEEGPLFCYYACLPRLKILILLPLLGTHLSVLANLQSSKTKP